MPSKASAKPAPDVEPGTLGGPRIGPGERLSATITLSLIAHAVLILGLGFTLDDAATVTPTLDVILSQTSTMEPPKEADFLAQANNQGGGDRDRAERPRENQLGVVPKTRDGLAAEEMIAQAPPPEPLPTPRSITTTGASEQHLPLPREQKPDSERPLPSGRELLQKSLEMARLAAEVDRNQQLYARRPKRKQITASTREFEYAEYMRQWVQKVKRTGNANYPAQARDSGLSGRLIMTVMIRPDGSVGDITLTQPSGHRILDEAAIRTVRLAQPFPPPPKTRENIDELYITRTWKFVSGSTSVD